MEVAQSLPDKMRMSKGRKMKMKMKMLRLMKTMEILEIMVTAMMRMKTIKLI